MHNFSWAQVKYDTIMFNNLTLNEEMLFTKFKRIQKFIDDTETKVKVFSSNEAHLPLIHLKPQDIIYSISSQDISFSYLENEPKKIYITYVKFNKNLVLKIKHNNTSIVFPKRNNLSILKKFFNNSFNSFQNDKKEFRLILKSGNQFAYCCLVFNGSRFIEIYLLDPLDVETSVNSDQ